MSKRRTHSPEFKSRVAIEAISGRKTLQEIAADHAVHPIQMSQWKKPLLDSVSDLCTRANKTQAKDESHAARCQLRRRARQLRRRVTPGPPPAMAGGGDSEK